ncbi:MAG: hypothetical protein COT88_00935 [Candidatus Colwellbacteria bacterium CG10_big_fil_rev_8_21_14_0_10_41_28]|uniref:Peptidase C51 domain-containing protein n=1 Tax=Candidatus Colwellbacteria bacterium CG10_big_fil_rev_8_21_14_0_10_41_28 TaxID=1974539 RepID=A0A2H0VHI8_9BACT|nr:MAG: hypothetical protein COT88_00935 [Candidatus Colwellbacteria bacterium CG10_big_fil_rev_8_21_14_0_10_41_28]
MKVKFLLFDTYIEVIEKSVGSEIFQTTWGEVDGVKKDLTNKGQFSCASYVSSILLWFAEYGLIETRHVGVAGLLRDMEESGWYKISEPKLGAIIHWERTKRNGSENEHVGFYVGEDMAINNDPDSGVPKRRHYTPEKIEGIYWHPSLDK